MALAGATTVLTGLIGLHLRLGRGALVQHLAQGVAVPLVAAATLAAQADASAHLRLALGTTFFSACFVSFRAPAARLVADANAGTRTLLLAMSGMTPRLYRTSHALEGAAFAVLPLAVLLLAATMLGAEPPASAAWLVPFLMLVFWLQALGTCLGSLRLGTGTLYLATDLGITVMLTFCPVFYGMERVPAAIRPLIALLPPSLGLEAMLAGWHGAPMTRPCLLLLAWTALTCLLARSLQGLRREDGSVAA